jgi:hypothetical protein
MDTQWPQDIAPDLARRSQNRRAQYGSHLQLQIGQKREETEAFIARVFRKAHAARITGFLPVLLAMRDPHGRLISACGLRSASGASLFLEQYLDCAIEQAITTALGVRVPRSAIVEIGNLAVASRGSARELIVALTRFLVPTPFQWVVFTALPNLRNAFTRLRIPITDLGEARLDCLPPSVRLDWGNYYDAGPRVNAVSVDDSCTALDALKRRPG